MYQMKSKALTFATVCLPALAHGRTRKLLREEGNPPSALREFLCGPDTPNSCPTCPAVAPCQPAPHVLHASNQCALIEAMGGDACSSNGECVDTPAGFTCACDDGFYGDRCDVADVCEQASPCTHGICHPMETMIEEHSFNDDHEENDDLNNDFTCICDHGWHGTNCDLDSDGFADVGGGYSSPLICPDDGYVVDGDFYPYLEIVGGRCVDRNSCMGPGPHIECQGSTSCHNHRNDASAQHAMIPDSCVADDACTRVKCSVGLLCEETDAGAAKCVRA